MRKMRNALIYLAIFVIACGATVAGFSMMRDDLLGRIEARLPWTESHIIGILLASDPCPADEASDYDCWDKYYQKLLTKQTSHVALLDLKARYTEGGYPRLYCHTILHEIGEKAGEEYGNVADAYAHGDPFCRSGYYHGVLEGIFGEDGAGTLLTQLDTLCAKVKGKDKYSYDYFACVHGVGHGLMAYFDHDLFKSLDSCDKLTGEWEQSSCYGGAFMENVMADTADNPSKFLKKDDPLYPCNTVKDKYRYQCYLMQTSHMIAIADGDFAKVFGECATVPSKYQDACYQSLGRDASGWSYGSVDAAAQYCSTGMRIDQRGQCLAGAAVDFIQSSGPEAARTLCKTGSDAEAKICSTAVEYQLSTL